MRKVALIVFLFPVISLASKKLDYRPCLKALNEKSVIHKNKIIPVDEDGWTFLVKGPQPGAVRYVGEGATYFMSSNPAQCKVKKTSNVLDEIKLLYVEATAFGNDPQNSIENKKEIVEKCKYMPGIGYELPKGTGMMMSGQH